MTPSPTNPAPRGSFRRKMSVWARLTLVVMVVGVVSGCCTRYPRGATIPGEHGRRLCAKHRIALVTTRGYDTGVEDRIVCILPEEGYLRAERCYPNALEIHQSLQRSDLTPRAVKVTYCPRCEASLSAAYPSAVSTAPQSRSSGTK